AGDDGVSFTSSGLLAVLVTWLEPTTGSPPWRLLIALKAMMPATATTCSKSTIKSARESFMFGSDKSSKSAPEAVARRVVARSFFLREKNPRNLFISAKREPDGEIDHRGQRNS